MRCVAALGLVLLICIVGCGGNDEATSNGPTRPTDTPEQIVTDVRPADLTPPATGLDTDATSLGSWSEFLKTVRLRALSQYDTSQMMQWPKLPGKIGHPDAVLRMPEGDMPGFLELAHDVNHLTEDNIYKLDPMWAELQFISLDPLFDSSEYRDALLNLTKQTAEEYSGREWETEPRLVQFDEGTCVTKIRLMDDPNGGDYRCSVFFLFAFVEGTDSPDVSKISGSSW